EDGIRDFHVTGVQTCALPISTSRLKQIEKIKIEDIKPSSRQNPYIRFEQAKKLYRSVVSLEGVSFGYPGADVQVLENVSLNIERSEERRVGEGCRCGGASGG